MAVVKPLQCTKQNKKNRAKPLFLVPEIRYILQCSKMYLYPKTCIKFEKSFQAFIWNTDNKLSHNFEDNPRGYHFFTIQPSDCIIKLNNKLK